MSKVEMYYRPQTMTEALGLIDRPATAVLAGGSQLIANLDESIDAVVDLQNIGLDQIEAGTNSLTFGAMVRLQTVVEYAQAPELIRFTANLEGPNTFRHVGTMGGIVATAAADSELYAALLVHEAIVTVQSKAGERYILLADFVLGEGELVTAVTIATQGQTAGERVGRTPADKPIVSVIGRRDGEDIRLAICGVAERPILVAADAIDKLNPPADFRGSSTYRKEMAQILSARVLGHLNLTREKR